jgi:hypothetical protein
MNPERAAKKLDELRKRQERRKKDFYTVKPGLNHIRFLPNWTGDEEADFYRETAYHSKLGAERNKSAVCLREEGQDACPVCEMVQALWKTKRPEDIALAKEIKSYHRIAYNIVDLDDKEKGVQIWMSGIDVLTQLLGFCRNPKYGDVTDPINGRNVDVTLVKGSETKSGFNEYVVQPDPDRTSIENPDWLEKMVDLNTVVKPLSYEDLSKLLNDELPDEDASEKAEESAKAEKEPATPPPAAAPAPAVAKPSCFDRAKYRSDDADCVVCSFMQACQDRQALLKGTKPTTAGTPIPATPATPASETKPKSDSTMIQNMINRLKTKEVAK